MTPTTQKQAVPVPISAGPATALNEAPSTACPHCGSTQFRESSTRRGADLLPSNRGKTSYRCRSCRGRFYAKLSEDSATVDAVKAASRKKPRRSREYFWKRPSVKRHLNEVTIAGGSIATFGIFLYLLARSGIAF